MKTINGMHALEVRLAALAGAGIVIVARGQEHQGKTIEDLQDRIDELLGECYELDAVADAEKRLLTADERKKKLELLDESDALKDDIDLRERQEKTILDRSRPKGRQTAPDAGYEVDDIRAARPRGPRSGLGGFKSFGHMAQAVCAAGKPGAEVNPLLRQFQAAATTVGSEGTGADGGFAVADDVRTNIMSAVMGEDSLLARTDQMTTTSNTLIMPTSEATPWGTSGIQGYWEAESGTYTQSKPALKKQTIELNKLTALVPVTEELLEDAPALDGYIRAEVTKVFGFKLNLAIVQGTGAGMPLGLAAAPCLVTVTKESGQTADTVVHQNVVNMWSRLYAPYRPNSVWLANQDVEPQFNLMAFRNNTTYPTPVYMPPGGLNDTPYGRLMGRPVIFTQACETVGDLGDLYLTDLSQYRTVMKAGGIKSDVSIHFWFDTGETAFRFQMRIAGQPKLSSTIGVRDGSNTLSSVVTLAVRG